MTDSPLPDPFFCLFRKTSSLTLCAHWKQANAWCFRPTLWPTEQFVLSKEFPSSGETCLVLSHGGNSWNRTDVHFRKFCTPAATARPQQTPSNPGPKDTPEEKVWRLSLWFKRNTETMFSDPKQHNGSKRTSARTENESQADKQLPLTQQPQYKAHHWAPVSEVTRHQWFVRQGDHG